jgi:hypothetical protein
MQGTGDTGASLCWAGVDTVAPLHAVGPEREALRKYLARQFSVLIRRHSPEDAILARIVADYHHLAVTQAKSGDFSAARRTIDTLASFSKPDIPELVALHKISALPARALIYWLEKDYQEATRLLLGALDACLELTVRYNHDYLTAKRIHLAANTARILASIGASDEAISRVTAIRAVIKGECKHWPFGGCDSLQVPLSYPERPILEYQLDRIASIAAGGAMQSDDSAEHRGFQLAGGDSQGSICSSLTTSTSVSEPWHSK